MCADPIVSIQMIRERAQEAFKQGASRDAHGFNWHATARVEWQAEWDRCAAERAGRAEP